MNFVFSHSVSLFSLLAYEKCLYEYLKFCCGYSVLFHFFFLSLLFLKMFIWVSVILLPLFSLFFFIFLLLSEMSIGVFLVLKMYIIWLTGFNSRCWGWGTQGEILYSTSWHGWKWKYRKARKAWRWRLLETSYIHSNNTRGKSLGDYFCHFVV